MRSYDVVRTLPPAGLPALIVLLCVLGMALQTIAWSQRQQQVAVPPAASVAAPAPMSAATLLQRIDQAQLFGSPPASYSGVAAMPTDPLPIALRGVLAGREPAMAILDIAGEQRAYRIGEVLYDDARLVAVEPLAVTIQRGPQRQVLTLEVAEALPRSQPLDPPAATGMDAAAASDLEALLGGVAVTPVYDERGRLAGYRLMPQFDDAMLSQMGMTREELEAEAELVTVEGDPEFVTMLQQMRGDAAIAGGGAP